MGKTWSFERSRARPIGKEPKGGGIRERLRIELADGVVELFVAKAS
jgi:hypothetical protein